MKTAKLTLALAVLSLGLTLNHPALADDITIGESLPLTGEQAMVAAAARGGAEALVAATNKAGGVNGHKLVLATLDDGFKPEKTAANVRTLVEAHNAVGMISLISAPSINAAVPVATELNLPIVGVMNGNANFRKPSNAIITHVRTTFARELDVIVRHYTTMSMTRFGVFHPDDAAGKAAAEATETALTPYFVKPVIEVGFDRNAIDFKPYAEQFAKANVDVIIIFSPTRPAALLINAIKDHGAAPMFACLSVVDDRGLFAALKERARGVAFSSVVPSPYDTNTPLVREYQKAMNETGQTTYSMASLEAYINAKVLVEGLKRVKGAPTRDKLRAALQTLPDTDLGGPTLYTSNDPAKRGMTDIDIVMLGSGGRLVR